MAKNGRPLKFKTVKELDAAIKGYFDSCFIDNPTIKHKNGNPEYTTEKKQIRPFTITGLALHLDTTRDTLIDYENRDKFSDTVKKAKLKIHNYAEEQLYRQGTVAGIIFNLKNNWKWKDTQTHEGGDNPITITVTDLEDK